MRKSAFASGILLYCVTFMVFAEIKLSDRHIPKLTPLTDIDELGSTGKLRRATININMQELTPELAKRFKFPSTKGALVSDAEINGAAYLAGVRPGDIILELKGRLIGSYGDVVMVMSFVKPSELVPMKIWRQGHDWNFFIIANELTTSEEHKGETSLPK